MLQPGSLKNKTIIVTGGGTGLGRSMSKYFLELGAKSLEVRGGGDRGHGLAIARPRRSRASSALSKSFAASLFLQGHGEPARRESE